MGLKINEKTTTKNYKLILKNDWRDKKITLANESVLDVVFFLLVFLYWFLLIKTNCISIYWVCVLYFLNGVYFSRIQI